MKTFDRALTFFVFFFLYAPLLIMVFYSFNASKSTVIFSGFSFYWYKELFSNRDTISAIENTLLLAFAAAGIATVLGTVAALGIFRLRSRMAKRLLSTVTNIPMMNPDIITGVAMMLLFVFAAQLLHAGNALSFATILIAHITFCLPYVILNVLPKLRQLDQSLVNAALDLGCTPGRAFFKVTLPSIKGGIVAGWLMSFTLSFDDFVISYYTTGANFQTLPLKIFSMTKRKVTPDMYALSTIIFFTILLLLVLLNIQRGKAAKKNGALPPA